MATVSNSGLNKNERLLLHDRLLHLRSAKREQGKLPVNKRDGDIDILINELNL